MTEMLDRVARAIATDNGDLDGYTGGIPLDGCDYEGFAKAAIKELRDPTMEMLNMGARASVSFRHDRDYRRRAIEAWRAMLDTALGKPTAEPDKPPTPRSSP